MAYNYFPQFNPFGNFQPPIIPQQPQQPQNGFMRVQSEEQARQYPVAVGNSMTFIDESKPYCYTKSMGFSQLDPPVFEKYKLVKEESSQSFQNAPETHSKSEGIDLSAYAMKTDVEACRALYESAMSEIEKFKTEIEKIKEEFENTKGGVLNE